MKKLLLLLIFIVSASVVIAQPGWNWPENKAQAEEKNVLYTDYLKQQNCEAAVEHLDWLIENFSDRDPTHVRENYMWKAKKSQYFVDRNFGFEPKCMN